MHIPYTLPLVASPLFHVSRCVRVATKSRNNSWSWASNRDLACWILGYQCHDRRHSIVPGRWGEGPIGKKTKWFDDWSSENCMVLKVRYYCMPLAQVGDENQQDSWLGHPNVHDTANRGGSSWKTGKKPQWDRVGRKRMCGDIEHRPAYATYIYHTRTDYKIYIDWANSGFWYTHGLDGSGKIKDGLLYYYGCWNPFKLKPSSSRRSIRSADIFICGFSPFCSWSYALLILLHHAQKEWLAL